MDAGYATPGAGNRAAYSLTAKSSTVRGMGKGLAHRRSKGSMTGNTKDVKQLTRSPYHLLKRAAQYAAHIYMGEVGKSGLTQRQFTVLLAVDQHDGISQTALVKMTGIDRSTLADLVARLLAQGYLQRRRTKDDGRTNSIRITTAGKKVLKAAQPGADEVDKQILAMIAPADRRSFGECLALLATQMDKVEEREPARPVRKIKARRRA
jgi:DNA-binding MarR family transcriptional regulator